MRVKTCAGCGATYPIDIISISERLKDISLAVSNHYGKIMILQSEAERLNLCLRYVAPIPVSPWKKLDIEMTCYKCGRGTKWTHHGKAVCYEECRVAAPSKKKVGIEDLSPELLSLIFGDDEIPDSATESLEIIKVKRI
jgi:hypothetical protein